MTIISRSIRLGLAGAVLAVFPALAAARPIQPIVPGDSAREAALLKKYDRNHDGVIGPAERRMMWADREESTLDRFDANDNGSLGPAETARVRAYRIENMIRRFDRNGDGRLSFAEARLHDSHLVEKFRLIDTDHDRLLSKRELIASPYVHTPVVNRRVWWTFWAPA